MNQNKKTISAFVAGLVIAGLAFMIMPATGLQGTLKAPNLDPIDFSKSSGSCSLTNCDLLQEIMEALGKTNSGVDTMTGFTHSFTAFTQDFHVFTKVMFEEMGLVERFEEVKKQQMEEQQKESEQKRR